MSFTNKYVERVYNELAVKSADEKEFLQAVYEVFKAIEPALEGHPEYEKNGYATEAYAAACEYALYGIGMNVVRGKCMKENLASKKMLSAILRPDGEDDTYFYFRKNVWRKTSADDKPT